PPSLTLFPYTTLFRSHIQTHLILVFHRVLTGCRWNLSACNGLIKSSMTVFATPDGFHGWHMLLSTWPGNITHLNAFAVHFIHLLDRKSTRLNSSHVKI